MSLRDCIDRAVAAGEMDAARAEEARALYDELERDFQERMSAAAAETEAAARVIEAVKREKAEAKRQRLLKAKTTAALRRDLLEYRNLKGENRLDKAMIAKLARGDDNARFANVEGRKDAVLGRLHENMTDILAAHRKDLLGRTRRQAELEDVVREIFGEATGSASAKELADAWVRTAELARKRFNGAGGRIPQRADWGMPQRHDSLKIRKASFGEWREFIAPKLDPEKMIDERTGLPFRNREDLDRALFEAFEAIRTEGASRAEPSALPRGMRSVANRRLDHRFLVFKDADSWLEYQARFGAGDPFDIMFGHLDSMARDIAQMEILGPNPRAALRWMQDFVEIEARKRDGSEGGDRNLNRARQAAQTSDEIMNVLTGSANAPINGAFAKSLATLRSTLQSAQLGSAAISAISDLGFQKIAAGHAGLPQARLAGRIFKLFDPRNFEDQKAAVRAGLIAENWSTLASAQMRYVGEVTGTEISRRLADFIMRASFLSPWTQAGRWAFGMEFFGLLADQAGRGFDQLPAPLRSTLERYGINAGDWEVIRKARPYNEGGAGFIRPRDIEAIDPDNPQIFELSTRVLEMIQAETEFAVPSSSVRGRVAITGDIKPGTIPGELLRSVAMYKNFAVTLAATHIRRAASQETTLAKGKYATNLVISTGLLGALSLNLKEIGKGRDPRPMESPLSLDGLAFWGAAILQGGGLGIFGDFLFADLNRFDRGLSETITGPVVGFGNDVRRLTIGNLAELAQGEETDFGREATFFLRRYTPGASLWYARLGVERLIFDQLQQWADPEARRAMRRLERRYRRDFDQRYFWRPGRLAPDRAPDLGNAIPD